MRYVVGKATDEANRSKMTGRRPVRVAPGRGPSADTNEFVVLLFDAAVDGVVEVPVRHHEVGDDLGVVDVWQ